MSRIKFFDPACGSGNFLIITYKELRALEIKIIHRLIELDAERGEIIFYYSSIQLSQLYGIEIKDFAHEMAQLSLWLAEHQQRARLSYPLTVQYIVYNELEEKIRKKEWHYNHLNPKELLLEIEKEAVELTYTTEIPNGLFRENYRQYPKEVIRELIINAFAHKKYTLSGDIFLEVYPDRMVVTSPGGLPLGVTTQNILHERQRRNPHLIQTFSDLKLMEGEGSGFDLIFEILARDAKPLPVIESDYTKVSVTVFSGSVNVELISILDYIDKSFQLTQKELITVGIIASEKKISTLELSKK